MLERFRAVRAASPEVQIIEFESLFPSLKPLERAAGTGPKALFHDRNLREKNAAFRPARNAISDRH
jgi:hypothetical protein